MEIQIDFERPQIITKDLIDKVQFFYKQPDKFLVYARTGEAAPKKGFNQKKSIPKQMYEELVVTVTATGETISLFMQIMAVLNGGAALAFNGPLSQLWGSISSLQLTTHLPLMNLEFPGHVEIMFTALIGVVTFDIMSVFENMGVQIKYAFTPTFPYNGKF